MSLATLRSALKSWPNRTKTKRAVRKPSLDGSSAFSRFAVESLEDRLVLSTIFATDGLCGLACTGGSSTLYRIDSMTGAIQQTVGPIGFNDVRAIDISPSGILYGYAYGQGLITIDTGTGAGTLIGGNGRFDDISFNAAGQLFGYGDSHTFPPGEGIHQIDLTTGASTFFFNPGHFHYTGVAIDATTGDFYEIHDGGYLEQQDSAGVPYYPIYSLHVGNGYWGGDFGDDGFLYTTDFGGSLVRVDTSNNTSTTVGFAFNNLGGLAFEGFPGFFTQVAPDPRTEAVPFVDVTFNDPITASTFDYNDLTLTLNGGGNLITAAVTVTSVGGNTYRIGNLAGLTTPDGTYLLKIDATGIDDAGAVPLKGTGAEQWITRHPLFTADSVAPLGSLVYETSESRDLPATTDVQNLQIDIDAGQEFTVRIEPTSTLRTSVTVLDPSSSPITSFTAGAAGEPVLLQDLPAAVDGTYTISVGTAGGTTGSFTLEVSLNTDLELESNGGGTNDTLLTAQDINGSFIDLTTGTAERGAVLGRVSAPLLLFGSDQNARYLSVNPVTGAATVVSNGVNNGRGYTDLARNPVTEVLYGSGARGDSGLYIVDPQTGAGTLVGFSGNGMQSLVWSPDGTTLYGVDQGRFGTIDAGTGAFSFVASAPDFVHGMAFHPGTGTLYAVVGRGTASLYTVVPGTGAFSFVGSTGNQMLSLEFLPDATLLGSGSGSLFSIDPATGASTFIGSTSVGTLIGLEGIPSSDSSVDHYSFTMGSGQTTTLALKGSGGTLELLDGLGVPVASGVSAANLDQVINNFAAAPGTYYARVTTTNITDYSLVVTRDADFDTENNKETSPQPLGDVETVLGHAPKGAPFAAVTGPSGFFAMTGAGGSTSTLYEIDPTTGQIIQTIGATGFSGITSMDFDPISGVMFASGGSRGASPPLMTIDLGTGVGTVIGGTGNFTDITISLAGLIYGYGDSHNFPGDDVYLINPVDGSFTMVGSPGHFHQPGIAFDDAGTLYFKASNTLFLMNPANAGLLSSVGISGVSGSLANVLEAGSDGMLYSAARIGGPSGPSTIYRINPANGVATALGGSIPIGVTALAFAGVANQGDFYTFNVTIGDSIEWTSLTPAGGPLEFVNNLDPYLELFDPSGVLVAFDDNGAGDGRNALLTHTALATGSYTVRVFGTNDTTGEYVLTRGANEPPTADANGPYDVDEGSPITLDGSGSTDDSGIVSYEWDLDYDGMTFDVDLSTASPTIMHTFPDDFSGTVGLRVTDAEGESDIDDASLEVRNVAPDVDAGPNQASTEGATVTLAPATLTDVGTLDTHTATINWGDGTPTEPGVVTQGAGSGSVAGSHVYADDGVYTVKVCVTDDDAGTTCDTLSVTITNVAPTITSLSTNSAGCGGTLESQSVTLSSTFNDLGTLDTHTATINWGDGNTTAGTVTESPFGPPGSTAGADGSVSGSHVYSSGGIYTITFTIFDDNGGSATQTTTVMIAGAGVTPGGVLQIIGTNNADHVTVNQQGNGITKVHANFYPTGNFKEFNSASINKILAIVCDGDDHVQISGQISLPATIDGGRGNDHLNGGGGNNILIGGDGDDMLIGGSARDIMIGGFGADRLVGNSNEDILVAGYTKYDGDYSALDSIMSEWKSSASYSTRVAHIRGTTPGGLNGPYFLKGDDEAGGVGGQTVFSDSSVDTLTGSSGVDWFFANLDSAGGPIDSITDAASGETTSDIDNNVL
jgi:hypothetical protein